MSVTGTDAVIAIVARDAEATIERALASGLEQGDHKILLVDNGSQDDTVARAQQLAGKRLRVVRQDQSLPLGLVRQLALEAAEAAYLIWLDADDEMLPGRADHLLALLKDGGADIVFDAAELHCGVENARLRPLPMPGFMRSAGAACRLFERSWVPCLGVPALRVARAQQVSYDPDFETAEDLDFVLRAIRAGLAFSFSDNVGYRQYAYPNSRSRNLRTQRAYVKRALERHSEAGIRAHYLRSGYSEQVALWAAVSVAMFREDWDRALFYLERARILGGAPSEPLEPEGPFPQPMTWRLAFTEGTLRLALGETALAAECLDEALSRDRSAEALNNLGVARFELGETEVARRLFEEALELFPDYLDARDNLASAQPRALTSHPLRRWPSRHEYRRMMVA